MLLSIAENLKKEWSVCSMTEQAQSLIKECDLLDDAHLVVELLEEHPELIGGLVDISELGRIHFGLRFSDGLRFELVFKLQELWREQPELEIFKNWSPFMLDTSWFECIQHIDLDQLSVAHRRLIGFWCAHFGNQEIRVIPKKFFRSLPRRSDQSGASAQPVVLNHRFVMQKYPVTRGMYAFWTGNQAISSPEKPQIFSRVLDVLRLCNSISLQQGKQQVYGPPEMLRHDSKVHFLSSVEGNSRLHGGMELEELMESITINYEADGWRIPSEVEWECAAKSQIKSMGLSDSHSKQDSLYFDYVGGDDFFEVGCGKKDSKGLIVPDAVGQKRLNARGLSDMSGAIPELCWGEGFPVYFEDMLHPLSPLKDPFLYGTDEEERLLTGVWSTRGGLFKTLSEAMGQRAHKYAARLVRTVQ